MGYVGGDPGKDVTRAQINAYHDAGMDVGINYEGSGTEAGAGFAAGVAAARRANAQADALGAPANVWIWYSVDSDFTAGAIRAYFQGIRSVSGRTVGAYGGLEIVTLMQEGLVVGWWQAMPGSWNGWGNPPGDNFPTDPRASIRQRYMGTGATYDGDEQMVADCGLWRSPSSPLIVPPPTPSVFIDSSQEAGPVAICTYPKDPTRKDQLVLAATGQLFHSASVDVDASLIHPTEWALNGLPAGTTIAKVSYCVWKGDGSGMWAQVVDTTGQAWESLMAFNGAFSPWTPATGTPLLKV